MAVVCVTGCGEGEPNDGPLEIHTVGQQLCWRGDSDMIIGLSRVTNNDDAPITATGVELVGNGDWSLHEGAILPYEYVADGQEYYQVGAVYYPPELTPKWDEARTTIPGAVIEPGDTVEFAYHATISTGSHIDHAELIYEDGDGDEYRVADAVSVVVDEPGEGCAADWQ